MSIIPTNLFAGLVLISTLFCGCRNQVKNMTVDAIKAYCIDFNWETEGAHGFAKPGLWSDADPEKHIKWYQDLGCNTVQTFAVSCNGYAWYKNGFIPEQPGLEHDFLTEMVKAGHKKDMQVFG